MNGATPVRDGRKFLVLVAPTLLALCFVYGYALPFLSTGQERLGIFWPIRNWLYIHVGGGIFALLAGPAQLWMGIHRLYPLGHRILSVGYAVAVGASSVAALYMAFHTGFGWVFGMGLSSMALAWIVTTVLAMACLYLNKMSQYKEWMVRSYIVTFGFVTYQTLLEAFKMGDIGTTVEQLSAASWACWSIPLLLGEAVLQGRKIFVLERKAARAPHRIESSHVLPPIKSGAA